MKSFSLVIGIALLGIALLCVASVSAAEKTKVLFIGKPPDHPYGSHMYLHTCGVLAKCVEQTEGVETAVSDGWPKDAALLKDVKTIVIYTSPAAEILLDGPHRDEVDKAMKAGVGLVTIHWASTVKKENFERLGEPWMSYLGGTWISNVGLSIDKQPLKQLDPKHPICRGWEGYDLHDEFYLNPKLTDKATPLLQVRTKDQDVVVGWAFERPGGGRSYATTLGHYYENFEDVRFRQPIVNAILWTAGREVPKEGAPNKLTAEELKLPPEKK
jgi:type 1 glutamine amidotransferase